VPIKDDSATEQTTPRPGGVVGSPTRLPAPRSARRRVASTSASMRVRPSVLRRFSSPPGQDPRPGSQMIGCGVNMFGDDAMSRQSEVRLRTQGGVGLNRGKMNIPQTLRMTAAEGGRCLDAASGSPSRDRPTALRAWERRPGSTADRDPDGGGGVDRWVYPMGHCRHPDMGRLRIAGADSHNPGGMPYGWGWV